MDVRDFLRKLDLAQYEPAFRDNLIDSRVLPKLTAEDLKDLGVTIVGHRRLMLAAIAALREPTPSSATASDQASGTALAPGTEASSIVEAERRPLSVMFCDLIALLPSPRASMPRICARSSAATRRASPPRFGSLTALSRDMSVMGC